MEGWLLPTGVAGMLPLGVVVKLQLMGAVDKHCQQKLRPWCQVAVLPIPTLQFLPAAPRARAESQLREAGQQGGERQLAPGALAIWQPEEDHIRQHCSWRANKDMKEWRWGRAWG